MSVLRRTLISPKLDCACRLASSALHVVAADVLKNQEGILLGIELVQDFLECKVEWQRNVAPSFARKLPVRHRPPDIPILSAGIEEPDTMLCRQLLDVFLGGFGHGPGERGVNHRATKAVIGDLRIIWIIAGERTVHWRKRLDDLAEPLRQCWGWNVGVIVAMWLLPLRLLLIPHEELSSVARCHSGIEDHQIVAHRVTFP